MPTIHKLTPVWARDFDNSPRHCFQHRETHQFVMQPYPMEPCPNWRDHPKERGNSEWLRWIHAFGDQVDRTKNPFLASDEDGQDYQRILFFEVDGHTTSDGRLTYCETYLVRTPKGLDPAIRVFLSNDDADRWARIEVYDEQWLDASEQADASVLASYFDEQSEAEAAA